MNAITLSSVCGLYQELYDPFPDGMNMPTYAVDHSGFLDANSIFWAEILSRQSVEDTVLLFCMKHAQSEQMLVPYRAIAADPKAFVLRVEAAKTRIADHGNTEQEFYAYLETLNLFCALYAKVHLKKETFNIQSGWILQEFSAKEIYENCLDEKKNPYLAFVKHKILPIITALEILPRIIFLAGRPGYFAFTIARLIKQIDPSIFICITRHSSEYFSLNKIDFLLKSNHYLFQDIDAIILEYFPAAEAQVIKAVASGTALECIKNLIVHKAERIIHTGYQMPAMDGAPLLKSRKKSKSASLRIAPESLANVHLVPHTKCYWNKCSFCGINKKYHFNNPQELGALLEVQLGRLRERLGKDTSYMWLIDEAFTIDSLQKIAKYFIKQNLNLTWQARCRIEADLLTEGLPELLAAAGLRELRMGLESGSESILRKMNKFDDTFSFLLLEEICQRYTACGISLHFPIIIGFPGESELDRKETYDLLSLLINRYPLVSFNINIFQLDIGSKIYQKPNEFGIEHTFFPCKPSFFLGNTVEWRTKSSDMENLLREQTQFMREQLYPWMPLRSVTQPHILYRLSETIRNTLFWKARVVESNEDVVLPQRVFKRITTGDITVFSTGSMKEGFSCIYSWHSHHYMLGDNLILAFLDALRTPKTLEEAIAIWPHKELQYPKKEIIAFIERLIFFQYVIDADTQITI